MKKYAICRLRDRKTVLWGGFLRKSPNFASNQTQFSMKTRLIFLLLFSVTLCAQSQQSLIPRPESCVLGSGTFVLGDNPVVECAEYMESSPLAAAEWVRFYGRLVGRASVADSLFAAVCSNFEQLRSLVTDTLQRPSLLCELKSNSAWYMPAGESTMGQMYRMAGAHYLFSYCKGGGSVPLSFETVLSRAANADVWLIKYNSGSDKSYSSLLADFGGYAHFKPFKERNVYACNTGKKPFYEETPFRPDLLLRELVALFYPQLLPSYKLRYYEKLQE